MHDTCNMRARRSSRTGVAAGPEDGSDRMILEPGCEYVRGAVAERIGDQHNWPVVPLAYLICRFFRRDPVAGRVHGSRTDCSLHGGDPRSEIELLVTSHE